MEVIYGFITLKKRGISQQCSSFPELQALGVFRRLKNHLFLHPAEKELSAIANIRYLEKVLIFRQSKADLHCIMNAFIQLNFLLFKSMLNYQESLSFGLTFEIFSTMVYILLLGSWSYPIFSDHLQIFRRVEERGS